MSWSTILVALITLGVVVLTRIAILVCTPGRKPIQRGDNATCHVAAFLGSGGHTTEMLQLMRALPTQRYTPRTFITAQGDQFSVQKAREANNDGIQFVCLPRARDVHQAWLSTPISTIMAFFACINHIVWQPLFRRSGGKPFADVIIMNGPGTCVPIVAAVYVQRILAMQSPRLIYIESFARVSSLSLTAKLLQHVVDRFVVQWKLDDDDSSKAWLI